MKKVPMEVNWNGNVFSILAGFIRTAKEFGWSKKEVDEVLDDATSLDYSHLIQVMKTRIIDTKTWHPVVKI
jgi:hypothetical protein